MVIAGGAGDNAAAACGIGAIRPGEGFVSLGTSGVLFVSNERFSPNTAGAVHAFCHAIPDTWHQMGVILSATDSLNWLSGGHRQEAGRTVRRSPKPGSAGRARRSSCPICRASARRTTMPRARGSFVGLQPPHRSGAAGAGGDGGRHLRLPRLPARAERCWNVVRPPAGGGRRGEIGALAETDRHQSRHRDRAARGRRFRRRARRRPARPLRRRRRRSSKRS